MQGPELRGPGVAEAFAIRASAERAAEYLFVRIDGLIVAMQPSAQLYRTGSPQHGMRYIANGADELALLKAAPTATRQWQRLRPWRAAPP